MPRRVGERDEHLLRPAAMLPDIVLEYGTLALEPILIPQSLEDVLGCGRCFLGMPRSSFRIRRRTPAWASWEESDDDNRRDRVGQHLAYCVLVQAEHPGGFPDPHLSTITARRTRKYMSTRHIHPTAHKHDFEPMDGGGRSKCNRPMSATTCPRGTL